MTNKIFFIISYNGNKRNEFQHLEKYLNLDGINNIIEPFAGTSAISFQIWLKYGDKFNYFLNDNSTNIFNIYELLKNEEPEIIINNLNIEKEKIKDKDDFLKLEKSYNNIYQYIVISKMSNIRFGLVGLNHNYDSRYKLTNEQLKFIEFIKCPYVHISCNDWTVLFETHKNDGDALFILDPPYLKSYNDFFQNKDINIYEYLYNNDISIFQSKIYIILEDMWIIQLLFKKNIIDSYGKQYGISKKKTSHIIITNHKK